MSKVTQDFSIYGRIGFLGLVDVVCESTPYPLYIKLFAVPYGLYVYYGFLKESTNLAELVHLHGDKFAESGLFRRIRPRYGFAKEVLEKAPYKIK